MQFLTKNSFRWFIELQIEVAKFCALIVGTLIFWATFLTIVAIVLYTIIEVMTKVLIKWGLI